MSTDDLPESPTDAQLTLASIFHERLVPIGGATTPDENRAFARAIHATLAHRFARDTEELEAFLREHPDSPWRASLLTNLGILWRDMGRLQAALDAWEQAWSLLRDDRTTMGYATADRAVSELAYLSAQLGRQDRLRALVTELASRPPGGSAAVRFEMAQVGLATMTMHPERSFRCGPLAVGRVWRLLHPGLAEPEVIEQTASTAQGTSIAQLVVLAHRAGHDMRAMKRTPGSGFVMPSVIHWGVGHFAALVGTESSPTGETLYVVRDPTFNGEIRTTARWLDEETSGYVLVPHEMEAPTSWQNVDEAEAQGVWGRGQTADYDRDAWGDRDLASPCDSSRGMARYRFHAHLAALHVEDTPIWLNPPYGPSVELKVAYNQADWSQPQIPRTTSFGARWTFNWQFYIDGDVNQSIVRLHMGGGGYARYRTTTSPLSAFDAHEERSETVLHVSGTFPSVVTLSSSDGSVDTYTLLESGMNPRWYLTQRDDPQGNSVTITYDAYRRITQIRAADGDKLTFGYRSDVPTSDQFYLVANATNSYGRAAQFQTTLSPGNPWYRLTYIDDAAGIRSSFAYGYRDRGAQDPMPSWAVVHDPDFLQTLTTPYGATTFDTGWAQPGSAVASFPQQFIQRWTESTLPTNERERIEFREILDATVDCGSLRPCGYDGGVLDPFPTRYLGQLNAQRASATPPLSPTTQTSINFRDFRNTYYWNVTGYARGLGMSGSTPVLDPRHAHVYHWIHGAEGGERTSAVLDSEVPPGQSRIFYLYQDQVDPSFLRPYSAVPGTVARPVLRTQLSATTGLPAATGEDHQIQYDAFGQVRQTIDPGGRARCYEWDASNHGDLTGVRAGLCSEAATSANRLLQIAYHAGTKHLPWHVTDAAGQVTALYYNARGQLIREVSPDGKKTDYRYDAASTIYPTVSGPDVAGLTATEGHLIAVVFPVGATADGGALPSRTTQFEYNSAGMVSMMKTADGAQRFFTYDALDLITAVRAPGASGVDRVTSFDYAMRDISGAATTGRGLEPMRITLPDGRVITRVYDALHRLIRSANGPSDVLLYRYNTVRGTAFDLVQRHRDALGDPPAVAWSVPVTPVASAGSRIGAADPAFQQTVQTRTRQGTGVTAEATTWTLDLNGRVRQVTEGSDVTTVHRRVDGLVDRACESAICDAATTPRTEYLYESAAPFQRLSTVQRFEAGAGSPTHLRTVTYRDVGTVGALSLSTVSETYGGTPSSVTYLYDALSRLWREITPTDSLRYEYDDLDRPSRLVREGTPESVLEQYSYPAGSSFAGPSEVSLPFHGCRRSLTWLDVTRDYQMASNQLVNQSTGAQISNQSRDFEPSGRLHWENDSSLLYRQYWYAADGRLNWTYDYNGSSGFWSLFTTTPHGSPNAYGITADGSTWSYVEWSWFDGLDRLINRQTSFVPYGATTFDGRGRLTNDREFTYAWDARNRLTSVQRLSDLTVWQFRYDADGRLRLFLEGGVWHRLVWVAGVLYAEYTGPTEASQPTLLRQFHADGVTEGAGRYLYDRDSRGSILRLVRNGQVARRWTYTPQGYRFDQGGAESIGSRLGFAGYVTHADTGLMFTPARVYSARTRQWLTRDPLGERDAIDGNDLYAYAANDPVNYTDPSGLVVGIGVVGDVHGAVGQQVRNASDAIGVLGTPCDDTSLDSDSASLGLIESIAGAVGFATIGMVASRGPRAISFSTLPLPPGMRNRQFETLVGWTRGSGTLGENLKNTQWMIERLPERLDSMRAAGMTRDMASRWAEAYRAEAMRVSTNANALPRSILMQAIADSI